MDRRLLVTGLVSLALALLVAVTTSRVFGSRVFAFVPVIALFYYIVIRFLRRGEKAEKS